MKHISSTSIKISFLYLTLFLAPLPVVLHAAERASDFEAYPVQQVFQELDEPWDDFVSRSGRVMRDYTFRMGFEAGGWLCVHPSTRQGAMFVFSNHSQISVNTAMKGCPLGGYRLTSEFMHSHPVKEYVVLTAYDLQAHPAGEIDRSLHGLHPGSRIRVGASAGRFSKVERSITGYLVHGDNLHYQKDGKQRLLRSIQAIQETPDKRLTRWDGEPGNNWSQTFNWSPGRVVAMWPMMQSLGSIFANDSPPTGGNMVHQTGWARLPAHGHRLGFTRTRNSVEAKKNLPQRATR